MSQIEKRLSRFGMDRQTLLYLVNSELEERKKDTE